MVAHDSRNNLQELLRAMAMPFQLASLLFVALTSVLLGMFVGGDLIRFVVSIAAIWLLLVWLTQYALVLIDDAANGVRESRAASVEMVTAFSDARAWIHPALGVGTGVLLYFHPDWPRLPVLIGAALVFPASLGACAITGHALDALHPGQWARVIRGLGAWYPATVGFVLACALLGMALSRVLDSYMLIIAAIEILLLLVYAGIGGVLYVRRRELDFEPRQSPERIAQRDEDDRRSLRQQFIDELYRDLRVRESARAAASAARWLQGAAAKNLKGDLHAILEAGTQWTDGREYPRLLRGLVPLLLQMRQPALALTVTEAGLSRAPDFSVEGEEQTSAVVAYALQTGRRRTAERLLDNYLQREGAVQPGPSLQALRERLKTGGHQA